MGGVLWQEGRQPLPSEVAEPAKPEGLSRMALQIGMKFKAVVFGRLCESGARGTNRQAGQGGPPVDFGLQPGEAMEVDAGGLRGRSHCLDKACKDQVERGCQQRTRRDSWSCLGTLFRALFGIFRRSSLSPTGQCVEHFSGRWQINPQMCGAQHSRCAGLDDWIQAQATERRRCASVDANRGEIIWASISQCTSADA